jgi:uncharacterized protein YmfQ (DUF2313 family)
LGFEKGTSLTERKQQLCAVIEPVEELMKYMSNLDSQVDIRLPEIGNVIIEELKRNLGILSKEGLEARNMKKKKEYVKAKLIDRGGDSNCKNGKFAYAVSAMIAFIHDINDFVNQAHASSCCHYRNPELYLVCTQMSNSYWQQTEPILMWYVCLY